MHVLFVEVFMGLEDLVCVCVCVCVWIPRRDADGGSKRKLGPLPLSQEHTVSKRCVRVRVRVRVRVHK